MTGALSCDVCGDALPALVNRAAAITPSTVQRFGPDVVACPDCYKQATAENRRHAPTEEDRMTNDRLTAPGFDRAMWVITAVAAIAVVGGILGALWGGLTILTLFKVLVTATLAWLVAGVVAHLVCSRRRS